MKAWVEENDLYAHPNRVGSVGLGWAPACGGVLVHYYPLKTSPACGQLSSCSPCIFTMSFCWKNGARAREWENEWIAGWEWANARHSQTVNTELFILY
jgi:hypothetical protein